MSGSPSPCPSTSVARLALALLLAGCLPTEGDGAPAEVHPPAPSDEAHGQPSASGDARASDGPARRVLATLTIRGDAPRARYARQEFGRPWADVDRNGCDTRDDILRRDLGDVTFKPAARACVVLSGRLDDPYTGVQIRYEHGASSVDIDHVVALGDAWAKGASQWSPEKRLALANDPLNLLAVDASTNRSKGDGDAATWLPPNAGYRCRYVARQIAVKAKYGLSLTRAEHDAMAAVLTTCPDEVVPVGDAPNTAPIAEPRAPAPAATSRASERPAEPPRSGERPAANDPNYGTCKQAKASGKGPYRRGRDPEYAYYQDRDGDGVVCE